MKSSKNHQIKNTFCKWEQPTIFQMPELTADRTDGNFSTIDFSFLARNDLGRYNARSAHIGHAAIYHLADGSKTAHQFTLPGSEPNEPKLQQLTDFKQLEHNGLIYFQATNMANGKSFTAKRYEKAVLKTKTGIDQEIDIAYFSEDVDSEDEETLKFKNSSNQKIARFKPGQEPNTTHKKTKKGRDLRVDRNSILKRMEDEDRNQNKVMDTEAFKSLRPQKRKYNGHSACDAYELYFKKFEPILSEKMIELLKRSFGVETTTSLGYQNRTEWLHAEGYALSPDSEDPQVPENLGAAPAWANTEMTILESMAKWFELNVNSSDEVSINALFTMLDEFDLIDNIDFKVNIAFQERILQFRQEIDPFKEFPLYRKGTDAAQATGIAHAILHNIAPSQIDPVYQSTAANPQKQYQTVPEKADFTKLENETSISPKKLLIFDLETTGLDRHTNKIIELGALLATFNESQGILDCTDTYNGLQDPKEPLSKEIKDITHISDEELIDQAIDWEKFKEMLLEADYVLCHNSAFDRAFIEANAPADVADILKNKAFGCTMRDINWFERGFSKTNLTYLNKRLGYKFIGHRAVNDCFATLNLLRQEEGAFSELLGNIHNNTNLICAVDSDFKKSSAFKRMGFFWSNGEERNLPKSWCTYVKDDEFDAAKSWLDSNIYEEPKADSLPIKTHITAQERYSERAELTEDETKAINDLLEAIKKERADAKKAAKAAEKGTKKESVTKRKATKPALTEDEIVKKAKLDDVSEAELPQAVAKPKRKAPSYFKKPAKSAMFQTSAEEQESINPSADEVNPYASRNNNP